MKAQIYEFNPGVYPFKLWVCANPDESLTEKLFLDDEQYTTSVHHNMLTTAGTNDTEARLGVVVFGHKKYFTVQNMAHEAAHVADYYFESLAITKGCFSDRNEAYAYLVGWAADCMEQVRTNKAKILI